MLIDITGEKFGRLTVIEKVPRPSHIKSQKTTYWRCLCDCGNETIATKSGLKSGNTRSCGCLLKESKSKRFIELNKSKRKINSFEIDGETTKVFMTNNYFIIDTIDLDNVIQHYWYYTGDYPKTQIKTKECKKGKRKIFTLHRFLLPNTPKSKEIDHIDRNKLNNKRENLRVVNHQQNMQNKGKQKNNTTGYKNISYSKHTQKYTVQFIFNRRVYYVGKYKRLCNAIKALEKAKSKIEDIYRKGE